MNKHLVTLYGKSEQECEALLAAAIRGDVRHCSKCRRWKDLENFTKRKNCFRGRARTCKACNNKVNARWLREHPEVRRDWATRNAEHVKKYRGQWLVENLERHKASQRRAYAKWRADPVKRKFWTEYYRDFMRARRSGTNGTPSEQVLFTLVEKACGELPDEIRESVHQDLFVGVLAGEYRRVSVRPGSDVLKQCARRAYQEVPDRFGHLSLDAAQGDSDLSWAEFIEDETDYGRVAER